MFRASSKARVVKCRHTTSHCSLHAADGHTGAIADITDPGGWNVKALSSRVLIAFWDILGMSTGPKHEGWTPSLFVEACAVGVLSAWQLEAPIGSNQHDLAQV